MAPLMENAPVASPQGSPTGPLPIARRVHLWDRALSQLRSALRAGGLREVSTPVRTPTPEGTIGQRPLLAPPEYLVARAGPAMKRLLCLSSGPIFQISHVFAGGDVGSSEREEGHLLEWYRLGEAADAVLRDLEAIVALCCEAANQPAPPHWLRVGFFDVVDATLGLRLRGDEAHDELRQRLHEVAAGPALLAETPTCADEETATLATWHQFVAAWSQRHLAPWLQARPEVGVHVGDYPAALAESAITDSAGWVLPGLLTGRCAQRFVSFYRGSECGGGSRELREPDEYLRRLQRANQLAVLAGQLPLPIDQGLLAALRDPGLPPCAGGSIQLDRVLMLACGAADVRDVSTLLDPAQGPPSRGGGISRPAQLVAGGFVAEDELPALSEVESRLAIAITPTMRSLIARRDDALGRQFIPSPRELELAPEERSDPIGDEVHAVQPGLIHRYPDRVLLKPTHLCSVYCRFCFRRDVVGDPATATLGADALAAALETIRRRPQIWEVILTGGDPLVLAPSRLAALLASLRAIPHVRVLRIHSRVPLVAPERITPTLLRALRGDKPLYVVLHTNHASEFTPAGSAACAALIDAGIPMLSQTVLLRGVNDSTAALETLMRTLVAQRIKPYYLHHPDLVAGTSHLRVSLAEGRALVQSLRGRLSGLGQPLYVLDIPGGFGKVPAGQAWVEGPAADGSWRITDPSGTVHPYSEPIGPARPHDGFWMGTG